MRKLLPLLFLFATYTYAQTPAAAAGAAKTVQGAKTTIVAIKQSVASDALNQAAKDQVKDGKEWAEKIGAARADLEKKNKPLTDQIADLQKKVDVNNKDAEAKFLKDNGPLQSKIQSENAQIQALVPVVKKENNLPDTATFDIQTQTWTVPAEKPEVKK